MALPKRRHSNTRTRKRRTHYKLAVGNLAVCKKCGEPIIPHRVCPSCGYYGDTLVISVKKKKKSKER